VNESIEDVLRGAEGAVNRLVDDCRKNGPVYAGAPKAVAQVNRTSKWLLSAITVLRTALASACADSEKQAS
jgi:hypothetical protein